MAFFQVFIKYHTSYCYRPSWVSPKWASFCPVFWANRRWWSSVQKRREALFFERRIERSELPLFSTALPDWPAAGLLFRIPVRAEGAEFSPVRAQACCCRSCRLRWGAASVRTACRRHLELRCPGQRFSTGLRANCHVARNGSSLGTLIPCIRCKASAHSPLQANETRLSAKEEVRPYLITQILPYF